MNWLIFGNHRMKHWRVKASWCAAQIALQKKGAIQRIHASAHERENGKIEELCQRDRRRDIQIHNADRNFPQKRWGTEGRSFDFTLTSYLPSLLLSSSGAHARCLNTPASAIGHRWIRRRNPQSGKCVYVCMSPMHNSGLELSISQLAPQLSGLFLPTAGFKLWEQRMLFIKQALNTGGRQKGHFLNFI